jgi:hypothetical protein
MIHEVMDALVKVEDIAFSALESNNMVSSRTSIVQFRPGVASNLDPHAKTER